MDVLNPTTDPASWDAAVSTHPDATIFHSNSWASVLTQTYGHQPHYLRFLRDNGEPAALIPIMEVRSPITGCRGVSLPFSDDCPPLLFDGCDPAAIRDCLATFATDRHWKHLELRGNQLDSHATHSTQPPTSPPTFLGHELDLNIGTEALLAGCSSSVRRALRKAARSQLSVRIDHSEAAMREFFQLHTHTRRRHGIPPQPYRFFENIQKELISKQAGFVALASHPDRPHPIAAAVFLTTGDSAIYKFGASDESEWNLRPNNLVMWEAIRFLAESGIKKLDLGRTTPGQEGLRRFKLSWGTLEQPIHYTHYHAPSNIWQPVILSNSTRKLSTLAHKLFTHAPQTINRLAGRLIYPHLD